MMTAAAIVAAIVAAPSAETILEKKASGPTGFSQAIFWDFSLSLPFI
jgi:hypothetical protein